MTHQTADKRHPFMGLDNKICKILRIGADCIRFGCLKKMLKGRNAGVKMILI